MTKIVLLLTAPTEKSRSCWLLLRAQLATAEAWGSGASLSRSNLYDSTNSNEDVSRIALCRVRYKGQFMG